MIQKYTSKDTCINTINRVYKLYKFKPNSLILDYGGGKYDTNSIYMQKLNNSRVLVYDPYNRTSIHNDEVLIYISKTCKPDYIVCSNVLNVICEDYIIDDIIKRIRFYANQTTTVIFSIYEGDRSGVGKETTKGWQRNQKTKDYLSFISQYFLNIVIKNGLIICKVL